VSSVPVTPKKASAGPSVLARVRAWPHLGKAVRIAVTAVFAVFWHPATQCLMLNVMDPWWTQTMAGRSWEAFRDERALDWPDYDPVRLRDLPAHVPQAALTSEDQRFYEHHGFDLVAIQRAMEHNAKGGTVRGASTISQQVARNVFLWQGRTWIRKGLEAWYTVWLELFVPKDRILELYLNIAETGPMTFGIEAGAQRWYQKPASELTKTEAASIVALLPAPRSRKPGSAYVKKRAGWIVRNTIPVPEDAGWKSAGTRKQ
jgi:monofunctional biosynthetic peptidoglycan transglycosylase